MKNRDTLKHKIESFSKIEKNWERMNLKKLVQTYVV